MFLPEKTVREIQKDKWVEQRQRFRAKLEALLDFDDPVCKRWNPYLKDLDPLLRMGRARPLAYEPGWTIRPGFYHWVRDNETTAPTVTPITDPHDGWCEPDSGVLEKLKRQDLRDPLVFAALLETEERYEQERERNEQRNDEERQDEVWERYLASSRVGVSMTDVPWTQNKKGRRNA